MYPRRSLRARTRRHTPTRLVDEYPEARSPAAEIAVLAAVLWLALVGVAVASMDVSATLLAATASAALRDRFRRDRAPSSAARARRRPRDARADLAVFDHYSAADPLPHGLELGQAAFVVLVAVRATAAATVAFELRDVHG